MNTIRMDLVFKLRDLAIRNDLDLSLTISDFFNYEANKQYKKAMREGSNYYRSSLSQEYSEHLFEVYERAVNMKFRVKS